MNEIGLDPGIDHLYAVRTIDEVHREGGKVRKKRKRLLEGAHANRPIKRFWNSFPSAAVCLHPRIPITPSVTSSPGLHAVSCWLSRTRPNTSKTARYVTKEMTEEKKERETLRVMVGKGC